jgi:putative spermidine/putrescine transport system ATP-binding protein
MMQPAAQHSPRTDMPATERYLDVARVSKRFGPTVVLQELDISVARSEFVSLLGPSGCGKTTLLRLIAGLQRPDSGLIRVDGADITHVAAHKRNIGVVFQNYALFPHLTVEQNVGFGLMAQRRPKAEIATAVANALELVRMQEYGARRISALSGGQQQRIAVARAIVIKPTLLLLDEPFSALDRKLRETMQIELRHLLRELGITSIFVTHDQDEALVMSDRIAVMNNGRIEQLGSPGEVYRRPASLHVLEFVGQSTRLAGTVIGTGGTAGNGIVMVDTPLGRISAPRRDDTPSAGRVVVGVRPESFVLGDAPGAENNRVSARLADIVFFGSKTALHFETRGGEDRLQVELSRLPEGLVPGVELTLGWPVTETMVYPLP